MIDEDVTILKSNFLMKNFSLIQIFYFERHF